MEINQRDKGFFRFSKQHRLYKRSDFHRIFKEGRRFHQTHLTACCMENDLGYLRLGISIGKKFGQANQRNRFKRLVREAFRQSLLRYNPGMDILIMPNNANRTLEWESIHREMKAVIQDGIGWLQNAI